MRFLIVTPLLVMFVNAQARPAQNHDENTGFKLPDNTTILHRNIKQTTSTRKLIKVSHFCGSGVSVVCLEKMQSTGKEENRRKKSILVDNKIHFETETATKHIDIAGNNDKIIYEDEFLTTAAATEQPASIQVSNDSDLNSTDNVIQIKVNIITKNSSDDTTNTLTKGVTDNAVGNSNNNNHAANIQQTVQNFDEHQPDPLVEDIIDSVLEPPDDVLDIVTSNNFIHISETTNYGNNDLQIAVQRRDPLVEDVTDSVFDPPDDVKDILTGVTPKDHEIASLDTQSGDTEHSDSDSTVT